MFKKIITVCSLAILSFSALAARASGSESTISNPLSGKASDLPTLVNTIIKYGLGIIGVLILLEFIYGGITWLMSQGDATKIGKARKMMLWSLLGLAVILLAYGIVLAILKAFGYTAA